MCITCGKSVENAKGVQQTVGGGVTLEYNPGKAVSLASRLRETLEEERKLALALDLDHTLLHTTMDRRAPDYLVRTYDGRIVDMDKVDAKGELREKEAIGEENCVFKVSLRVSGAKMPPTIHYIKLRPGVRAFLRSAAALFRMYIYTHGNRAYANAVARILDPDGHFFQNRIVSRTDTPDLRTSKSLQRLFPEGLDMALVVDDNERVYIQNGEQMGNLISCQQYHFWPQNMGEVNVVPGMMNAHAPVEKAREGRAFPGDSQLRHIWNLLEKIHKMCYRSAESRGPASAGRRAIATSAPAALAEHRHAVLKGGRVILAAEGFNPAQMHRWIRCLGGVPVVLDEEIEHLLRSEATRTAVLQTDTPAASNQVQELQLEPSEERRIQCCRDLCEKYEVSHVLGVKSNWKTEAATRYGKCWVLHVDWLFFSFHRTLRLDPARFLLTAGVRPKKEPEWDPERTPPVLPVFGERVSEEQSREEDGDKLDEFEIEDGEILEDNFEENDETRSMKRVKELAELLLDSDSNDEDD